MEVDWDLHAVVRGCNSSVNTAVTTSTATAAAATSFKEDFDATQIQSWFPVSPFSSEQSKSNSSSNNSSHIFTFSDPFEARNAIEDEELHELYKPFFTKSPQKIITSQPISSSISISSITPTSSKDQTQLKQQQPKQTVASSMTSSITPRKRRKNQLKRICHVPAEGLSSDVWAWRKYGQKPIKGSPYPRGYYRCSSSKGCLARKQVERNRSDPGMFIVTYTAEHNHPAPTHRNSLAGSTRQKPSKTQNGTAASDSNKPTSLTKPTFSSSSPATSMEEEEEEEAETVPRSTNTESRELDMLEDDNEEEDEEEEVAVSDIGICDDFFLGLEGLGGSEDSLPDHFPASFGLPWAANNAATAAGGI